jgi:hypothetical protein
VDAYGSTSYNSDSIFSYLNEGATGYTTAIWEPFPGLDLGIAFGLDTSLTVGVGWDNVTGFGTPDKGLAFLNTVAGK